MGTPYKRIIIPHEEEILERLSRVHPHTGDCPEYSPEWISKCLDAAGLQKKFGEDWDSQAIDIKDYYRAEGFRDAVHTVIDMKLQKQNKLPCDIHKMLPQDIPSEWKELIQKVVLSYLKGLLPYGQSKSP